VSPRCFNPRYSDQCFCAKTRVSRAASSRVKRKDLEADSHGLNSSRKQLHNTQVNICNLIQESVKHKSYFRVCLSGGVLQSWSLFRGHSCFSGSDPTIPLENLINSRKKSEHAIVEPLLSQKYKTVLAVILGYSLLQLSRGSWSKGSETEGSWLDRDWVEQGIRFVWTTAGVIDIGRPYLPTVLKDPNPDYDPPADFRMHPSPSILAFGMILIELQCDTVFRNLWADDDLDEGKETINTNYLAACRILDLRDSRLQDNVRPRYLQAIEACVRGSFLDQIKRGDDWSIQKAFFQNVIAPLEAELIAWGISPEKLHNSLYEVPVPEKLGQKEVSASIRVFSSSGSSIDAGLPMPNLVRSRFPSSFGPLCARYNEHTTQYSKSNKQVSSSIGWSAWYNVYERN